MGYEKLDFEELNKCYGFSVHSTGRNSPNRKLLQLKPLAEKYANIFDVNEESEDKTYLKVNNPVSPNNYSGSPELNSRSGFKAKKRQSGPLLGGIRPISRSFLSKPSRLL